MVHTMLFPMLKALYSYISTSRSMRAVWPFAAAPQCCSHSFSIFLRWFQFPPLLLVSVLFSHSTCATFPLYKVFYIWKSSGLFSWSHFCLIKLQCLILTFSFCIVTDCNVRFIVRNNNNNNNNNNILENDNYKLYWNRSILTDKKYILTDLTYPSWIRKQRTHF